MNLKEKILEIIKRNPNGIKASDIAKRIGVSRRDVNSVLYKILKNNCHIDDNYYWHINEEEITNIKSSIFAKDETFSELHNNEIFNWRKLFELRVLECGENIQKEKIHSVDIEGGEWVKATVQGTENYKVAIKKDFSEVSCSCPYAQKGNMCKHMAALLAYCEKHMGKSGREILLGEKNDEPKVIIEKVFTNEEICEIGNKYYFGKEVEQNLNEAINWFNKATNKGHPYAEYSMAFCYLDEGKKRLAYEWFCKAAQMGHVDSFYQLSLCYKNSVGVRSNRKERIRWLEKASDFGHEEAIKELLLIYKEDSNYLKYIEIAEKNPRFLLNKDFYQLCSYYRLGKGVDINYDKAIYYLDKIDLTKNDIDKESVAFIYYEISKKIFNAQEGRKKSFRLCSVAAEHGYVRAICGLAKKYSKGWGVDKDEKKAYLLWKEASEKGSIFAMKELILCEYFGLGTTKNVEMGKKLYMKFNEMKGPYYKKLYDELPNKIKDEYKQEEPKRKMSLIDIQLISKIKEEKRLNKHGFYDPFK